MIQHGEMVHDWYSDLIGECKYQWDFGKVSHLIEKLIHMALQPDAIRCYHIYHDCGKPYCRTVDDEGKQHFPNHAQISHDKWMKVFGNQEVAWFILNDMAFHTLKGEELKDVMSDSRAPTLLLTAWAELHANAQMFGGIESTSFKIKRKFLEKNTKAYYDTINNSR